MTSEIRVNKLTNRIGLSTVTFADSGIGVTVTGRIDPDTDSARDLGTTSVRWRNAYVDTYYGDGSNLTGIAGDKIEEGNTKAEVVDTGAGYFVVETDGVEAFRVNDNGKLTTGGENSPDVVTGGLCLNTGDNDGIFFSCKNSDIAHGRTSLDETDTLFSLRKISGSNGGVDMRGYTDSASADPAIRIFGVIDDGSNASYCPLELRGARKNSGGNTGTSQMHSNRGVVRISNDGDVTVATFTGQGLCFGSDIEAANALDDYEEGTFTPTNANGSGVSDSWTGHYTKIGNVVHFRINQSSGTFGFTAMQAIAANYPYQPAHPGAFVVTNGNPNISGTGLTYAHSNKYLYFGFSASGQTYVVISGTYLTS